jgi:hypothetical protein
MQALNLIGQRRRPLQNRFQPRVTVKRLLFTRARDPARNSPIEQAIVSELDSRSSKLQDQARRSVEATISKAVSRGQARVTVGQTAAAAGYSLTFSSAASSSSPSSPSITFVQGSSFQKQKKSYKLSPLIQMPPFRHVP